METFLSSYFIPGAAMFFSVIVIGIVLGIMVDIWLEIWRGQ
jgi:hypothetical protein